MAKMTTNGITYDTQASKLLHQHVLREQLPAATRAELADWAAQKTAQWCVPIMPTTHLTVGMERLYRRVNDGSYWIHEIHAGTKDIAIPLSEQEARAWLKDRCGGWRRYARLEARVFSA